MKCLFMFLVLILCTMVRASSFCLGIQSKQISYVNSIWNEFLCDDGIHTETPSLPTLIFLLPLPQKEKNENNFQKFLYSNKLKQVSLLKSTYFKKNRHSSWFQCNGIRLLESVEASIGSKYCIVSKIASAPTGIDQKIKNSYEVVCTDETVNTFNAIESTELENYFECQGMKKIMDVNVAKSSGFTYTLGCNHRTSIGPAIMEYIVYKK
jgi:hypothetical protein